jgi:hypothetical protein
LFNNEAGGQLFLIHYSTLAFYHAEIKIQLGELPILIAENALRNLGKLRSKTR